MTDQPTPTYDLDKWNEQLLGERGKIGSGATTDVPPLVQGNDQAQQPLPQAHTVPTPSRRADGYHVYKVKLNGIKITPIEYVIMADTTDQARDEARFLALREYDQVAWIVAERMDV